MIDLTAIAFRAASVSLLDYGGVMRPATGAKLLRIDRQGNRFKTAVELTPETVTNRAEFIADLIAAKTEGARITFPLQGVNQGAPGSPQVNGAGQSGSALSIKGLTPGFVIRKGFWLSIVNAAGQHYLHNALASATASGGGTTILAIRPMLRHSFANSATIHIAAPKIEGLIDGDEIGWSLFAGGMVDSISFTIEEAE